MNKALQKVRAILEAIADGYEVESSDGRYISVANPDFFPDNGQSPRLVLDVAPLFSKAECPRCRGLGGIPISVEDYDPCPVCGGEGEIGPLIT